MRPLPMPDLRRLTPLVLGTLLWSPLSHAAPPQSPASSLPPADRPSAWDLQTEEELGRDDPAWQRFQRRYPGRWQGRWDTRTRRPAVLYGPGIRLASEVLVEGSDAFVHALAVEFLADNEDLLRLGPFELDGIPSLAGETWIVDFRLSYQGVELEEHSRVALRIKRGDAGLALLKLERVPAELEPVTPGVPAPVAVELATRLLPPGTTIDRAEPPRLCLLDDKLGTGRLAWRFAMTGSTATGELFAQEYFVHARERARLLEARDLVHNQAGPAPQTAPPPRTPWTSAVTGFLGGWWIHLFGCSGVQSYDGYVRGRVLVAGPNDYRDWRDLSDVAVTITQYGSGSTYSNSNGDFTLSSGSSHWLCWIRVRAALSGRWCDVDNWAGSDLDGSRFHGRLHPYAFSLNFLPTEDKTAQTTAYYWTTRAHNWSSGIMGGNNGVERQIDCNVNVPGSCNAFFSSGDGSINFYDRGGSCPNMAYSDVIAHEYGHAVDFGRGSILDGAYSEGFGDAFAMAITDQRLVGRGTFFVRDGSNVRLWPAPECGGGVHCVGETYGGFTYELTQLLKAKLGYTAGRSRADRLVLLPAAANPSSIPDAVLETFVADDGNSSLNDGTPNWCEIVTAARSRNLPVPTTSPTVHYRFDSSAQPGADSSSPAHHGTTNATFVSGGGVNGSGALAFTLESPYDSFVVPDSDDLDQMASMTGSAWVFPAGNHDVNPVNCIEGTVFTKGYNYWFQVNNDNSGLLFQNEPSGAEGTYVRVTVGTGFLPVNTWTHIAFVRTSATSVRFYKNGVYIGGGSTLLAPSEGQTYGPLTIGNPEAQSACEFNGRIDEVQIFPRALCDAEVEALYCTQVACIR